MIDMTNLETRRKVVLLTIISGLSIELQTGMKVSRGVTPFGALKRDYPDFKGKSRFEALEFALEKMMDLDPEYVPSARILKLI